LLNHRWFGETIRNFREQQAIRFQTNVFAVGILWITILFSTILIINQLWIRILPLAIAVGVSIHILHFKTIRGTKD